jgi:CD109 antigen
MWHQQFAYPDGRVQFRTTVPNVIATWVITAVAISRLTGFGVLDVPFIYEGTRQFFIKVEIPPIVRLGEQIGARVDVFNFQSHRIEALIILHASDNYRFVNLDQNGVVTSYAPRLTDGQNHVLVILYPNEVRRLYLPFVAIVAGEVEVMIEGKQNELINLFICLQNITKISFHKLLISNFSKRKGFTNISVVFISLPLQYLSKSL